MPSRLCRACTAVATDGRITALQFPPSPSSTSSAPGVFARATLARYPNANAELDLFPAGYITDKKAQSWLPPTYRGEVCNPKQQCGTSVNLSFPAPREEWHGMYQVSDFINVLAIAPALCH